MVTNKATEETALAKGQISMGQTGLVLQNLDDLWRMAGMIWNSGTAPKSYKNQESVVVAILHGAEVGFNPMQAVQAIAVINGKPSLYGDAMLAVVRNSGKLASIEEHIDGKNDDRVAVCSVARLGDPAKEFRFSWRQATVARLVIKDVWKAYPERMLMFKARAWALRDTFGDILMGLASAEEQMDIIDVESKVIPTRDELMDQVAEAFVAEVTEEMAGPDIAIEDVAFADPEPVINQDTDDVGW